MNPRCNAGIFIAKHLGTFEIAQYDANHDLTIVSFYAIFSSKLTIK